MGSTSCSKRCMIVFEILCALISLVLIAFGIYVLCSYETNEVATLATYAYIGVGVATLVIMFFGCFGALRENVCCTVTFIVLLVIIVIAQVAVVFLLTKGQQSVASNLANTLDAAWEHELTTPGAMTQYENWFDCCGRASPQDYVVNGVLPPASCYKNHDNSLPTNLITKGCRVEFENYWMHLLLVFNILGWVLIGLQVVGSIVSCMHCNSIRNDRRRSYF